MGVISNASGQIAQVLARSGICQVGEGSCTPMRVIIDSHIVGVAKPDPRIFDFALEFFPEIDRARIAYIGDSATMDIGGARAAGLHGILLDPHDDHLGADFDRLHSLEELLGVTAHRESATRGKNGERASISTSTTFVGSEMEAARRVDARRGRLHRVALQPASVLDAGCGMGRVAMELDRRGIEVEGADLDDDLLAFARVDAPHIKWHLADLATARSVARSA